LPNLDTNFIQVFDFLDGFEGQLPRHILLLYEEPELARIVTLRFLKNGLKKGECCTYIFPEEVGYESCDASFLEQEMQDNGIDTSYYKQKGLLHFYSRHDENIPDVDAFKQVLFNFQKKLLNQVGPENQRPVYMRGVGRAYRNIQTKSGMIAELQIEKYFQNDASAVKLFGKGNTWICTYKVDNIQSALEKEAWVKELVQNHDSVIYLPRDANGLALNLK